MQDRPKIILVVCVLILAPFLVVSLFRWPGVDNCSLMNGITASDLFTYCASASAAIATIISVRMTINSQNASNREVSRLNSKPYIAITMLKAKKKSRLDRTSSEYREKRNRQVSKQAKDFFDLEEDFQQHYEESEIQQEYVVIRKAITYLASLSSDQAEQVEYESFIEEDKNGGKRCIGPKVLYTPLRLKNVGLGAAVDLRYGVNRIAEDGTHEDKATWARSLAVGDGLCVGLYVDTKDKEAYGKYVMLIDFYDAMGNHYRQEYPLSIGDIPANKQSSLPVPGCSITYHASPHLLEKARLDT